MRGGIGIVVRKSPFADRVGETENRRPPLLPQAIGDFRNTMAAVSNRPHDDAFAE